MLKAINKIALIFLFLIATSGAWALERVNVTCSLTGPVVTQGLPSSNKAGIIYPSCRITVYFTGTTNQAQIFSDNNTTPTPLNNPFTANTAGQGSFYVALGRYDITMSGGGMPQPATISDVLVQDVNDINGTFASSGSGPPTATCGPTNQGQTYTDITNGNLYACSGTAWVLNIGPTGPTGPTGPQGVPGVNCATTSPPNTCYLYNANKFVVGGDPTAGYVTIGPHAPPATNWTFDTYSPQTALNSLSPPASPTAAAFSNITVSGSFQTDGASTSLAAACSAAASAKSALYISQAWTAQSSLTCSAPVSFPANGLVVPIQPASGQTITFTGGVVFTGTGQICDTSLGGTCVFTTLVEINVGWFGAKGGNSANNDNVAIAAAINSSHQALASGAIQNQKVRLNAGSYYGTTTLPLYDGVKIEGVNLDYGGNAGATSFTYPNMASSSMGTQLIFNPSSPPNAIAKVAAPSGTGASGGSMAAGTYYASVECYDNSSPALHSQWGAVSAGVTIDGSTTTQINWIYPAAPNASTCRLYVGTVAYHQTSWFSVGTTGGTYSQTATSGTAGQPDITNTSAGISLFVLSGAHPGSSADWSGIGVSGLNIWGNSSMDQFHCTQLAAPCGIVTSLYAFDLAPGPNGLQFSNFRNIGINGFQAGFACGNNDQENTFENIHIERGVIGVLYKTNQVVASSTSAVWRSLVVRTVGYAVYGANDSTNTWSGESLHERFEQPYLEDISYYTFTIPVRAQEWEVNGAYIEHGAFDTADVPDASMFFVGQEPMTSGEVTTHLKTLMIHGGQFACKDGLPAAGTFLNIGTSDGVDVIGSDAKRCANGIVATPNVRNDSIYLANPMLNSIATPFTGTTGKIIGQYRVSDTNSGNDTVNFQANLITSDNVLSLQPTGLATVSGPGATGFSAPAFSFPVPTSQGCKAGISGTNSICFFQEQAIPSSPCTGAITTSTGYSVTMIANAVIVDIPPVTGTATAATSFAIGTVLPVQFRPVQSEGFLVAIEDNGAGQTVPGYVTINGSTGVITVFKNPTVTAPFTSGGVAGLNGGAHLTFISGNSQ